MYDFDNKELWNLKQHILDHQSHCSWRVNRAKTILKEIDKWRKFLTKSLDEALSCERNEGRIGIEKGIKESRWSHHSDLLCFRTDYYTDIPFVLHQFDVMENNYTREKKDIEDYLKKAHKIIKL